MREKQLYMAKTRRDRSYLHVESRLGSETELVKSSNQYINPFRLSLCLFLLPSFNTLRQYSSDAEVWQDDAFCVRLEPAQ